MSGPVKGTCSGCRQSLPLYQQGDGWRFNGPRPWVVGSHSKGRRYLCPGSHKPPLPKPRVPVRLITIAAIVLIVIVAIILVLKG